MALYSGQAMDLPFRAAIDLNSYQYRFVTAGSIAGEVTLASSAAGSVLGVLQNDPRPQEEATVRVAGTSKVLGDAASALTFGGLVKTGSDGTALGSLNMAASTFTLGICLKAVATGCAYTEVFLRSTRY